MDEGEGQTVERAAPLVQSTAVRRESSASGRRPVSRSADGNPVFALPGETFGPDLDVHASFPRTGLYRLWGQFRTTDGTVITTVFTVEAGEGTDN
jgi:hypothetical protein